ncbi:hypothetical protein BDV93DRAFT_538646 [Ceratobasidium sp. AG-I]|nr:hypothetical protein BDV93DRAFT_538646 [Ceratobasidium sp. AG-I]
MDHLHSNQVGQRPVHYIPNFITEEEESALLRKIATSPASKWRNLSKRRLQVWGGDITKSGTLIPQDLPSFVTTFPNLLEKLRATGAFAGTSQGTANHVILNEYLPGQGITPHQDGPAYHPVVATLSLGSHTVMEYYQYQPASASDSDIGTNTTPGRSGRAVNPSPALRLLLEPRSLVITHGDLYTQHLHGISGVHSDHFTASPLVSSVADESLSLSDQTDAYTTQSILANDVANRELLGSHSLRNQLNELAGAFMAGSESNDVGFSLERDTRTSLTCRVVEKTANAVGKLVRLK